MFWWDIRINSEILSEEYREYTDIILSPDRIDLEIINSISCGMKKNQEKLIIVNSGSWGIKKGLDHIDITTGNIHREDWTQKIWGGNWEKLTWDGKIKQLILVKNKNNGHLGPRIAFARGNERTGYEGNEDYLIFQRDGNVRKTWISKVVVPKKCYYPQVFDVSKTDEDLCCMIRNILDGITKK